MRCAASCMATDYSSDRILTVCDLTKTYARHGWLARDCIEKPAIDRVCLSVRAGQTLVLTGPSGAGKTTLALCITGIETPDSGEVWFEGRLLSRLPRPARRAARHRLQIVPQDASASLNPGFTAAQVIEEPMIVHGQSNREQRRLRVLELLDSVGLPARIAPALPAALSSGQRARLAIARALALHPAMLILDESFASLDFSVQAQMLNLLLDLQSCYGLTYLFIAHDLRAVVSLADEVAVMQGGRILPCPEDEAC